MNILEKYIYLITFVVLVMTTFISFIFKKKEITSFLNKNTKSFTFVSGIVLTIIGLWYTIAFAIHKSYIHFMMGDLCQFLGLVSGAVFLSCSKKAIKALAPWMLAGGLITLCLSHPPFEEEGIQEGLMSYLKHTALFVVAVVTIYTHKFEKRDYINSFILISAYLVCVLLTSGVAYWVTGDDKFGAWSTSLLEPSYREVTFTTGDLTVTANDYEMMSHLHIPYPIPSIIFIVIVSTLVYSATKGLNYLNAKYSYE